MTTWAAAWSRWRTSRWCNTAASRPSEKPVAGASPDRRRRSSASHVQRGESMSSAIGRRALRQIAAVLVVVLLPVAALGQTTRLTFLHTNDNYEIVPTRGWGGFAQLMTVLKEQRAASTNPLTTFGGDLLSPSIMSGFHRGAQMIE